MKTRDRIDQLMAEAHEHGYGSELPAAIAGIVTALADAVDAKAEAPAPASDPAIADHERALEDLAGKVSSIESTIDERVEAAVKVHLEQLVAAAQTQVPPAGAVKLAVADSAAPEAAKADEAMRSLAEPAPPA